MSNEYHRATFCQWVLATICLALVEVTTTSVTAFTAAVVFTKDITVCPGCSLTNCANLSAGQLSAQTVKHSHARVLEIANQAGDTMCRWRGAVIQKM